MEKVSVSKELMLQIHKVLIKQKCEGTAGLIKEELPELFKPKFEVGEWRTNGINIFRVTGFNNNHLYVDNSDLYGDRKVIDLDVDLVIKSRPATPQEIENHLTALKEKKGFKHKTKFIGVRDVGAVRDHAGIPYEKEEGDVGSELIYNPDTDTLYCSGRGKHILYEAGQWATIIEKPDRHAKRKEDIANLLKALDDLLNNL